jgi:hypothetical protein
MTFDWRLLQALLRSDFAGLCRKSLHDSDAWPVLYQELASGGDSHTNLSVFAVARSND